MPKVHIVIQHLNPGDEFALTAYTDEEKAKAHVKRRRKETGTRNFSYVSVEEGEERK